MGPVTRSKRTRRDAPAPGNPPRRRLLASAAVVAVAAALAWATWRPSPPTAVGPPAGSASSRDSTPAGYAPLVGNWVRPDGGYVLSVSGVGADGAATASYFNPQPIRVARAEARREDGHVGLFVEFDHPNYPGSTYTLAYDPATDTLKGIYYQALQQARYDVEFVRQR